MAAIVWDDVTAAAPALSTVSATAQTDILAHVNAVLDADGWGGESSAILRLARIYLAAHFGTMTLRGTGGATNVTMETAGGLSRQYAFPAIGSDPLYGSTSYGQMYLVLLGQSGIAGPVVL